MSDTSKPASSAMQLLARGVPLTLLLDLVSINPTRSAEIYRHEGGRADWLRRAA